eukprot:gene18131-21666_t
MGSVINVYNIASNTDRTFLPTHPIIAACTDGVDTIYYIDISTHLYALSISSKVTQIVSRVPFPVPRGYSILHYDTTIQALHLFSTDQHSTFNVANKEWKIKQLKNLMKPDWRSHWFHRRNSSSTKEVIPQHEHLRSWTHVDCFDTMTNTFVNVGYIKDQLTKSGDSHEFTDRVDCFDTLSNNFFNVGRLRSPVAATTSIYLGGTSCSDGIDTIYFLDFWSTLYALTISTKVIVEVSPSSFPISIGNTFLHYATHNDTLHLFTNDKYHTFNNLSKEWTSGRVIPHRLTNIKINEVSISIWSTIFPF